MFFIVSGRDHPGDIEPRLKWREQHRAHYNALGDDLILAGPYLDAAGQPIGSMIVIRRSDQSAADSYAQADPYVREGVFKSVRVDRWDWFMKRPPMLPGD
jgi:uncharacterized protein YciI